MALIETIPENPPAPRKGLYPSGSALAALNTPITHRVRVPKRELDELNIVRNDVDVDSFVLSLVKHRKHSIDVRASVTAADVELSIEGAHQLVLTLRDADRRLQASGALDYSIDINVEGWWWRLQRRQKSGDNITLTFEPRIVAYLRAHTRAKKASRGKVTRAEFILTLIRAVKKTRIQFYCPELHKKQPIGKIKERDERKRTDNRDPGLDEDFFIEIDGSRASERVMKNLERVLIVGDEGVEVILPPRTKAQQISARRKVQVATMMCVLQESRGETSATNGVHVGLFQQNPKYWPGTRDPEKDAEAWYRAVITADHANPRLSLVDLIEKVQNSGQPQNYAPWRDEAEDIVAHFSDTNGPRSTEQRQKYEFKTEKDEQTGKRENYWGAIIRLADEVVWRAFTIKNRLIYMSEEDLFKSKSLMTLTEGVEGVDYIDYDDDDRKDITEVTVTCRMRMWDAPLGSTVTVKNDCSADGKYLVVGLRRSYFHQTGEIKLRKPQEEKPEPPPKTRTINVAGSGAVSVTSEIDTQGGAKGIVDKAVRIAQEAGGSGVYVGSALRDGDTLPSGQFSDHADDNSKRAARDIGVQGINLLTGPPSGKLDQAVVAIGEQFGRDYGNGNQTIIDTFEWRGYRVQIIWRTPKYGGHMGHIHIGVLKVIG